jgi:hypothetical protein
MSFESWRRQMRMTKAIELLVEGRSIKVRRLPPSSATVRQVDSLNWFVKLSE